MSPASGKKRPWVILARVPNVVHDEDDEGVISPGTDLGFLLRSPPGVTILRVPRCLAPEGTSNTDYPYVAAADEHGDFLLLCSGRHSDMGEYLEWLRTHSPEDSKDFQPIFHPGDQGLHLDYFLCDTSAEKVSLLPSCPGGHTLDPGSVGLMRRGGEMMVVELRELKLLCCSAITGPWIEKKAVTNWEIPNKLWHNGVFCHAARLWWVDLSRGLYTCDPFEEHPLLCYIPLPNGCELPEGFGKKFNLSDVRDFCKSRCVAVSNGQVMFCHINQQSVVEVWRMNQLVDEDWMFSHPTEGMDAWTLEHKVPLCSIWSSVSYKELGLKQNIPIIGLLHPQHPSIIYFIEESKLFAVDLLARKVMDCEPIATDEVPEEFPSCEFLMAWSVPPPNPKGIMDRLRAVASPVVMFGVGLSLSLLLSNSR